MANDLLKLTLAALGLAALPGLGRAQATAGDATTRLAPVVVTATRTEALPFDVPASIDRIDGSGIRDARLQVNLSESLG
ncbi:MAG: TonB-dependent siderophore receptor, partial [Caldimonas sp.]